MISLDLFSVWEDVLELFLSELLDSSYDPLLGLELFLNHFNSVLSWLDVVLESRVRMCSYPVVELHEKILVANGFDQSISGFARNRKYLIWFFPTTSTE